MQKLKTGFDGFSLLKLAKEKLELVIKIASYDQFLETNAQLCILFAALFPVLRKGFPRGVCNLWED
jgi:hypothetical protein